MSLTPVTRPWRAWPRAALLAALATFAAACADEPTAPDTMEPPARQMAEGGQSDDAPPLTSNAVRYRSPAYEHATGRSGGASLTARALKNMDGSTDLEVTTGELDGEAPHDIRKLQVKYLPEEDSVEWTENYNRVRAASAAYTFGGDLARHAKLQVQGNIIVPNASGKGRRTGVVTIQERINLRPDLAVTDLNGPSQVIVGTSGLYLAEVSEMNGDVGATANCVFYIDGDEVARAQGIWVAEGDLVSCPVDYPFIEVGTYELTVAVEGVDPADFDPSNNSASMAVEVIQPEYQLQGTASASEDHSRYYCASCTGTYRVDRHETNASFYGSADAALTFPTSVSISQKSGGHLQDAFNASSWGVSGGSGVTCNASYTGKSVARVCSDATNDRTWVNVTRRSGRVTYWSRYNHTHYYYHRHYYGGGYYDHVHYYNHVHYSYSENQWHGGFQRLGGSYTFDVRLEDSDGVIFKSDPVTIPLTTYSRHRSPWTWWGKEGSVTFGN